MRKRLRLDSSISLSQKSVRIVNLSEKKRLAEFFQDPNKKARTNFTDKTRTKKSKRVLLTHMSSGMIATPMAEATTATVYTEYTPYIASDIVDAMNNMSEDVVPHAKAVPKHLERSGKFHGGKTPRQMLCIRKNNDPAYVSDEEDDITDDDTDEQNKFMLGEKREEEEEEDVSPPPVAPLLPSCDVPPSVGVRPSSPVYIEKTIKKRPRGRAPTSSSGKPKTWNGILGQWDDDDLPPTGRTKSSVRRNGPPSAVADSEQPFKGFTDCDAKKCYLRREQGLLYFKKINPFDVYCDKCERKFHPCCSLFLCQKTKAQIDDESFAFVCESCE
jgi:hypothetical protein